EGARHELTGGRDAHALRGALVGLHLRHGCGPLDPLVGRLRRGGYSAATGVSVESAVTPVPSVGAVASDGLGSASASASAAGVSCAAAALAALAACLCSFSSATFRAAAFFAGSSVMLKKRPSSRGGRSRSARSSRLTYIFLSSSSAT